MKLMLALAALMGLGLGAPMGPQTIVSPSSGSLVVIPLSPEQLAEFFSILDNDQGENEGTIYVDDEEDEDVQIPVEEDGVQEVPDMSMTNLIPSREKRSADPEPFFFRRRRRFNRRRGRFGPRRRFRRRRFYRHH
ncbi:hypothetical protein TCAL_14416 [Tigriopus californicus]|uniref:Uncharacterized protein n=2 Tax=Tigriopus californicus TaxID=6832 RepID=A0A553PLV7_TIGCA|nr:hypothetical protein TCAL_14416 [Tigriopus californicus]